MECRIFAHLETHLTIRFSRKNQLKRTGTGIVHLKSPGIHVQTRSLIAHASLVNLQVTNECNAPVHERVKQLASAIRKFMSE